MAKRHADAEDNADYYEQLFLELVNDDKARKMAIELTEETAASEELTPTLADVSAGKRYLRQCMLNMSLIEVRGSAVDDLAALWARGAVGAARYRREQSGRGARGR
jgi:hypothetical protein